MTTQPQPEPVDHACHSALQGLSTWLPLPPSARASVLCGLADALDARRADIITTCSEETALTPDELAPEFARMTGTFRLFADTIERGTWHVPAIDTPAQPGAHSSLKLIGPNHDIRRTLVPLGPVAVFGASNFPLAYGVCGGDTASALAAGCTVVVKEHPAHPKTGRLLFTIAATALKHASGITGLLNYVANEDPKDFSIAKSLVQHDAIAAVGFTGSVKGGLTIDALCRDRKVPIPAFCEMGSANPVLITPRAAERNGAAIADALADSILARHGQQCTRPGIILALGEHTNTLAERLANRIAKAPARDMLAPWIRDSYTRRVAECIDVPGVQVAAGDRRGTGPRSASPVLLECSNTTFQSHSVLRDEVFGPAATLMRITGSAALPQLLGSLTLSVYADDEGDHMLPQLMSIFDRRAGRIIVNGVPTGVRVAHAMVHSGPFPSCNRPDTTAVGPLALQRWCRPVCYQNCPDAILPDDLKNTNPRNLLRLVNGEYTREPQH